MFAELSRLVRDLEDLRNEVRLIRSLIRMAKVKTVDVAACTVVVEYHSTDATNQPSLSHPMPWLQRGTEHRPPAVGDHAVVLDTSLGKGAAVAITGWPSTAKPPAGGGGDVDTLAQTTRRVRVHSTDIELGQAPSDYAALASKVDQFISGLDAVFRTDWTPVSMDGGSALKAAYTLAFVVAPTSVAASQVKLK